MGYEDTKKVAKYYDERADNARDNITAAGQWLPIEHTAHICEEICRKIKLSTNHKVLELGSGSDVLGKFVRARCTKYVGLDISSAMIKISINSINDGEKPDLIQSTTHLVPFRDNVFDITILNSVAMYLRDEGILEKTLLEMERVTTPQGTIFVGENITASRVYWEYTWFQNLHPTLQILAKPYVRFRLWLAKKNSVFAGKWRGYYAELSLEFLEKIFNERASISMSDAAGYTIRKRYLGKNPKGNHRVDFVINLAKGTHNV
jgi:ubiquinone/menaquinone biosynthesis C-methylase UbiE